MKKLQDRFRDEQPGSGLRTRIQGSASPDRRYSWIFRLLELLLGDNERFGRAYKLVRLILVFLLLVLIVLAVLFIVRAPELVRLLQGDHRP